ncbi:MAG: hypothetical protein ACK5HR_01695 [Mycoplasmatales bacterium]
MDKMIELETKKLYYGATIFLIGYKHEEFGYKFSTMSSSYSISNMMMCGLDIEGDSYKQISKYNNFSLNILSTDNINLISLGDRNRKQDRFTINKDKISYTVDKDYDVPLINNVASQIICTKTSELILSHNPDIINVGAQIKKRLVNEKYMINGRFIAKNLDVIAYFADSRSKDIRKI